MDGANWSSLVFFLLFIVSPFHRYCSLHIVCVGADGVIYYVWFVFLALYILAKRITYVSSLVYFFFQLAFRILLYQSFLSIFFVSYCTIGITNPIFLFHSWQIARLSFWVFDWLVTYLYVFLCLFATIPPSPSHPSILFPSMCLSICALNSAQGDPAAGTPSVDQRGELCRHRGGRADLDAARNGEPRGTGWHSAVSGRHAGIGLQYR